MAKLKPKQQRFVDEYLIDLNATQAAIRAGYAIKTAQEQSSRLLSNVMVQNAMQDALQARSERTKVDADYVLHRLVEIDQMDVLDILADDGSFKDISLWPKIWRQYLSGLDILEQFEGFGDERTQTGFIKKIKWPDKIKNLEMIGRHVDVQAFKEKLQLSNDPDNPLTATKDMIELEVDRRIAELERKAGR